MLVDIFKKDGSVSGEKIELVDSIFGIEPNDHVIYLAVKAYLANQRQGTHKSKERGEVSGGGKKPWKQKGRGGARAGTSRSPLWVGGGTIFGPRPRDYRQSLPKAVKALAKKSALSLKVRDNQLKVVEDFTFESPKTKDFASVLASFELTGKKVLFLTSAHDEVVYKSARNIDKTKVQIVTGVSTYELLNCEALLVQKGAAEWLNNQYNEMEIVTDNA